jgi:hypothetical protein
MPNQTPLVQRRALLALAVGVPVWAGLGGCASLSPRNLVLSQADLQTMVERQFPKERRVLEVVDLNLSRPLVRLYPERNRIGTDLELTATERLSGRTVRGSMALDHGLRFEPSDGTVRLAQVKVQELKLDLGGRPFSAQAERLSGALAERVLDDFVLYRVPDERRQALRQAGLERAEFVVTQRGIELRFVEGR